MQTVGNSKAMPRKQVRAVADAGQLDVVDPIKLTRFRTLPMRHFQALDPSQEVSIARW
jgi:hypothetical protein